VKVDGSYTFQAPQDAVWQAVLDPDVLSKVIPGSEDLEQIGENQYQARMKIRIGPVQGVFSGTVELSDVAEPHSYHLQVDGKGAPGFVKGEGDLRLEPQGDQTVLHYEGDAQVGGRLASVGQRLMDSSAQALIRQSLEALDAQIQARLRGEAGEAVPAAVPPSQLEFAAGVTRKMIADAIPPEQRPQLAGAAAAALAVILVLWLVNEWWTNRLARRVVDVLAERDAAGRA
jgi:uncharacterized protein